jgi:hypothetical protein
MPTCKICKRKANDFVGTLELSGSNFKKGDLLIVKRGSAMVFAVGRAD